MNETLSFKVSAGLKNIIGKDLISDRYIAVFELVKNSYDAGATRVKISFIKNNVGNKQLLIEDDGCGMNYEDIKNKWLFVAYSAKKKTNTTGASFRDRIKREIAGSKGVGRFSCDRLGERLTLVTKVETESYAHEVKIQWNQFETDDTQEFINIPVDYSISDHSPIETKSGTILIIDDLREEWDRNALLRLKRSLMKLISPDTDNGNLPFEIEMTVPDEFKTDYPVLLFDRDKSELLSDRYIVNGIIRNDVFEKIDIKTTSVRVAVSQDEKTITSTLYDRGEQIFSLKERNVEFRLLHGISITLFYLNRSAKFGFTKQMGIQPVRYGSIFVYKNGFRIYDYGEPERDFFNIDKRKAQGYKRFLGTRELMGRITIHGDNSDFIETSSRAHGFIETPSLNLLSKFFVEKVLKVLEKYVVNVINWGEPLKSNPSSPALQPSDIGEEVIAQFFKGIDKENIVEYKYNREILRQKNSQNGSVSSSLRKLEHVANVSGNSGIVGLAKDIRKKTNAILSQNLELERDNETKGHELQKSQQEGKQREQQIFFLKGANNQNVKNLINGMHSIFTLTEASKNFLHYLRENLKGHKLVESTDVLNTLAEVYQANQKANKLAELAIKGNQHLKHEGQNNVYDFICQYVESGLSASSISYEIAKPVFSCVCMFDPASLGLVIDNIASNSLKASAGRLDISFTETLESISISFADNGVGLLKGIDPSKLFEWGLSTTSNNKGFGIGLHHIELLVNEMQGTVAIDNDYVDGFRLVVTLKK